MFEILGYDGHYPNLCSGTMTVRLDGKEIKFCYFLSSGGSVSFDSEWNEHVTSGPWSIDRESLPEEVRQYAWEIQEWVNNNVPYGCCGGCV